MSRPRKYRLKARAESQELTRQRIVEAAMALHQELGLARTSFSAVAERAGVQRLTLYRHFPDELSLLRACGGRYRELHPAPDLDGWRALRDRTARLSTGLGQLYRFYRENAEMIGHVLRDAELSPVVRQAAEPRIRYVEEAAQVLCEGWPEGLTHAAIVHAVQFHTWRSFARRALSDEQVVRLMTRLAAVAR